MFGTVTKYFREKVMDLSVEKMVTRTSSINQNYKENTLKVVTMYSSDHL